MARKAKRSKQHFQPRFETLEPRQMLSLSTALPTGIADTLPSEPVEIQVLAPKLPTNGELFTRNPVVRFPVDTVGFIGPLERPGVGDILRKIPPSTPRLKPLPLPSPPLLPEVQGPLSPDSTATEIPHLQQPVNLVISEDSFFLVRDSRGRQLFTRDGRFLLNDDHELVRRDGLSVLGYQAENGELDERKLVPLNIPLGSEAAKATETVTIAGSLDPTAHIGEGTTSLLKLFGSHGQAFELQLEAVLSGKSGVSTEYRWTVTSQNGTLSTGLLVFNSNGAIVNLGEQWVTVVDPDNSVQLLRIQLDFEQVSGLASTDNFGNSESTLNIVHQDGFPPGRLNDYAITETGEIRGVFSNGLEQVVAQIPLATIADPFALRRVGRRLYAPTVAAGSPSISSPGVGTHGHITRLPADYFVAKDGQITNDRNYKPTASSLSKSSPTSLRYPWTVRSSHLKIDGQGYFAVKDRRGRIRYTRDGHFHLNRHNELVTRSGLRVLGHSVVGNFEIDPTRLVPLTVPLGTIGQKATEKVKISGTLSPRVNVATSPAVIESVLLGNDLTEVTKLVDVVVDTRFGLSFAFQPGELQFIGRKGGRSLEMKTLQVTATTTVGQWMKFLEDTLGIDNTLPGQQNAGAALVDGKIRITSNLGLENEIRIGRSSFIFKPEDSLLARPLLIPFQPIQAANGEGVTTDFVVYDQLGSPLFVRVTTYVEAMDADSATHRWIATSTENQPARGIGTVVGNGQLVFGSEGTLTHWKVGEIVIERSGTGPLIIQLDFSHVSSTVEVDHWGNALNLLNTIHQDGFPPGALERFEISPDGEIRGFFTNRMERSLGQVQLAKFPRFWGLRPVGRHLFTATRFSGRPRLVEPGSSKVGQLQSLPPTLPSYFGRDKKPPRADRFEQPRRFVKLLPSGLNVRISKLLREFPADTLRQKP